MFKVGDKVKLEDLPLVEVRDSEHFEWEPARDLKVTLADVEFKHVVVLEGITQPSSWKFMRPIQEPEMRPMTDMEIIDALKKEGCALKDEDGLYSCWDSTWKKQDHTITYDGGKTWGKLEVSE